MGWGLLRAGQKVPGRSKAPEINRTPPCGPEGNHERYSQAYAVDIFRVARGLPQKDDWRLEWSLTKGVNGATGEEGIRLRLWDFTPGADEVILFDGAPPRPPFLNPDNSWLEGPDDTPGVPANLGSRPLELDDDLDLLLERQSRQQAAALDFPPKNDLSSIILHGVASPGP